MLAQTSRWSSVDSAVAHLGFSLLLRHDLLLLVGQVQARLQQAQLVVLVPAHTSESAQLLPVDADRSHAHARASLQPDCSLLGPHLSCWVCCCTWAARWLCCRSSLLKCTELALRDLPPRLRAEISPESCTQVLLSAVCVVDLHASDLHG